MGRKHALGVLILLAALMMAGQTEAKEQLPSVPSELRAGEGKFNANCARCHGERGIGSKQGPPLVHKIYEPNHHGDAAFLRAAAVGVRAHHWNFGDMPKVEGVTSADVEQIIKYIRWLQRQAGIN
jgi:cytochrome c